MTKVEQLTLDFSAQEAVIDEVQKPSSNVHSLDAVRKTKVELTIQNAYRGIFDSVKHIKLRRKKLHEDEASSSFG